MAGQDPCQLLEIAGGIWRFDENKLGQKQADGKRYATGNAIPQDNQKAYFWLTLGYLHGDKSNEKMRTAVAAKLPAADIASTEQAAQNWHPRKAPPAAKQ